MALKGSDAFLLIPLSKNFFELPDISEPLDYRRHVGPMIADMTALLATAALVRKVGAPDDGAETKFGLKQAGQRQGSPKQSRRRDFSQRLPVRPVP